MVGAVECRPYDPKDPLRKNTYKHWDIVKGIGSWVAFDVEGHKHFYSNTLEGLKRLIDESDNDSCGH